MSVTDVFRAVAGAFDRVRAAPAICPAPVQQTGRMANPTAFFAGVRKVTGPLSAEQVATINRLLVVAQHWPASWLAYGLATAHHETGGKLVPNVENLNYSVSGLIGNFGRHRISTADAQRLGRKAGEGALSVDRQRAIGNVIYGGEWGRVYLGNTQPDDGWTFRGRGMDHCTGRRNYSRTGDAIGVDLLANPDALLDVGNAVAAIVTGMESGRYTGRKLATFLKPDRRATLAEFTQARPIINAMDKATLIAGYADKVQTAAIDGGWG